MADLVFKATATNDEERLVFGLAMVSVTANGETYTDLQDDQITPAELEKAFYGMVADGQVGGDADHDGHEVSTLVECFVVTPEKLNLLLKACGYAGAPVEFKGTAAWVGYRINDPETWKRVKSGELKAFSIEGQAERVAA